MSLDFTEEKRKPKYSLIYKWDKGPPFPVLAYFPSQEMKDLFFSLLADETVKLK